MDHTVQRQHGITVVSFTGSVDALTAAGFQSALQSQLEAGEGRLVADLAEIDYVSSAGLRAMSVALQDSRALGGDLRLAAMQSGVYRVLEMSGFTRIMQVFPDVASAVASFAT